MSEDAVVYEVTLTNARGTRITLFVAARSDQAARVEAERLANTSPSRADDGPWSAIAAHRRR